MCQYKWQGGYVSLQGLWSTSNIVVQARTASAHFDQNIGFLQEGHLNPALSSETGVKRATYSTNATLSASDQAAGRGWRLSYKKNKGL